jgi:hypothetical protein
MTYILYGFHRRDEPALFKAAVTTIGDVARGTQDLFQTYIADIVPQLISILKVTA